MSNKGNVFEDKSDITLMGQIMSEPELKYDEKDKFHYYEFIFDVLRKSFEIDKLPVRIKVDILGNIKPRLFDKYIIDGEIRTDNIFNGKKRILLIYVFASEIEKYIEESFIPDTIINMFTNSGEILGTTVKLGEYRKTPLGREIRDTLVAVNRMLGNSYYIPCIMWGSLARNPYKYFEVGKRVNFDGRLQSRLYDKQIDGVFQKMTAYEFSIKGIFEQL